MDPNQNTQPTTPEEEALHFFASMANDFVPMCPPTTRPSTALLAKKFHAILSKAVATAAAAPAPQAPPAPDFLG